MKCDILWKRGKLLWQEDDARPPGRELVHEAWHRLFGERLPNTRDFVEECPWYDGGDAFYHLAPNGATWCVSYDGGSIYAPVPALAEAASVLSSSGVLHQDHDPQRPQANRFCAAEAGGDGEGSRRQGVDVP